MQSRAIRIPLLPLIAATAVACSDQSPTETQANTTGFVLVSGPGRTDTVVAYRGSFVLELQDENRTAQPGATVVIRSLVRDKVRTMFLDSTAALVDSVTRTTDARGRFSIAPRFGRLAGAAGLILAAPSLGIVDTLEFTVKPGTAYRVAIAPHDTAVRLNKDVKISIAVVDRYGNARPESPTIQAGSGIRLASDGRVTGVAYGRAPVVAQFGSFKDSGSVTVVPPGRLTGMTGSSVFWTFVVNTDGSGADGFVRQIGWPGGSVRWSRDAAHVLVSSGYTWTGSFRLYEVTVSDHSERLVWSPPQGTQQGWPSYSSDGEWIYFIYIVGRWDYGEGGTGAIWRVRRDGTSAQEVVPAPATGGWLSPAPSPDGNSLAYAGTDGTVFVRTLATGATKTVSGLSAMSVSWSPNGSRLLIAGRAGLFVVGPDGSGRRQLRPGVVWGTDAAWSPDGDWVIWNSGGGIELVRLDPELALTLPFSYGSVVNSGWGFAWGPQP